MTRPTPAEEIRALKVQIDRQAEAITARNIKISMPDLTKSLRWNGGSNHAGD